MEYPFTNFEKFVFRDYRDIVYVIGVCHKKKFYPFYVGESTLHLGRIGGYISANESARTDYRVGTAIKILKENHYKVELRYTKSSSRSKDEMNIINSLKTKFELLNEKRFKLHKEIEDFVFNTVINKIH